MILFLDSNALIAVLNGRPPIVGRRLLDAFRAGNTVSISSIVLFELCFGIANSRRQENNLQALRLALDGKISVVPFDEDDAKAAAAIRSHLKARGTPIGPYDVLIAAQAARRGATIVTANVSEFARVPDLAVLDWTAT